MISHRSQLRKRHQGDRNGRGLIHPPHRRRGLCLHPHHKCRHYHPNTLVRTLAPLAMHRSWPWSSSNVILGPITKLAGLPLSTASNDTFSSFLSAFFGLSPPFPSPSFGIWHRQAARGVYPIFVLSPTLLQTLGPGIYTIISIPLPAPFHDFSSITNYPVSFHSSATTCFPHDFMPGISLRHYPLASSSCPHFETEPSEHLFPSACAYRCMRYMHLSHTRVCVRFEAPLDVPSCFHGFWSLLSGPPPVY